MNDAGFAEDYTVNISEDDIRCKKFKERLLQEIEDLLKQGFDYFYSDHSYSDFYCCNYPLKITPLSQLLSAKNGVIILF